MRYAFLRGLNCKYNELLKAVFNNKHNQANAMGIYSTQKNLQISVVLKYLYFFFNLVPFSLRLKETPEVNVRRKAVTCSSGKASDFLIIKPTKCTNFSNLF